MYTVTIAAKISTKISAVIVTANIKTGNLAKVKDCFDWWKNVLQKT